MAKITDLPLNVSGAGQDYNYVTPNPVLVVLVKSNATPQNRPRTAAIADAYIAAEISAGRAYSASIQYYDPRAPLQLEVALDDASDYSYGRINIGNKKWYVFVTGTYLNKSVSVFDTYIDRLATYNATLGHSTVLRGHVGVAASQSDTYGENYCLEPEPIFVPSIENEYSSTSSTLLDPNNASVAILATADLNSSPLQGHFNDKAGVKGVTWDSDMMPAAIPYVTGTPWPELPLINRPASGAVGVIGGPGYFGQPDVDDIMGTANPFASTDGGTLNIPFTYDVPIVRDVTPSTIDGVTQAGALYVFSTVEVYQRWMAIMRFAPWVTDTIKSAWLIPSGHYGVTGATTVLPVSNQYSPTLLAQAIDVPVRVAEATTQTSNTLTISDWRDGFISANGNGIFRKLATSQFSQIQLSDRNSKVKIDPELHTQVNATAVIAKAILPSGGTYRARFTGTEVADERELSIVGQISTQISVQNSGRMAVLGRDANQMITAGWHTRADVQNALFHSYYNRYSQTQTNIGQANVTYSQNILSMFTGGLIG